MTSADLAIGVDVDGVRIAGGVVDSDGHVLAHAMRETPVRDVDATEDALVDLIDELAARHHVRALGVGAAGWVDATRSTVYSAPDLAWRDEQLGAELAERCGMVVVVENAGSAAAWGEHRFGASRGFSESVLVTVGSTLGGGLVLGGQLYRGGFGMAGEFGHLRVVPDGRPCTCGNNGCWQQYASGDALVRAARQLAAERPVDAETLLGLGDGTLEAISSESVTEAAQDDDTVAIAAFAEVGQWLGQGLADLVAVLDPSCIVLGGELAEAGELLLEPTRDAYEGKITGHGRRPFAEIRLAERSDEAAVIGAADLARM